MKMYRQPSVHPGHASNSRSYRHSPYYGPSGPNAETSPPQQVSSGSEKNPAFPAIPNHSDLAAFLQYFFYEQINPFTIMPGFRDVLFFILVRTII
jgi:hypothetical protein